MKPALARIEAVYLRLNHRERVFALLILLFAVYFLWDTLMIGPELSHQKALAAQINSVRQQLTGIEGGMQTIATRLERREENRLKARIHDLRKQLTQTRKTEQAILGQFIPPSEMARVLRDLLITNKGIRLIRMESMKSRPIKLPEPQDTRQGDVKNDISHIYQHGIKMTFSGDYFSIMRYLQSIESLSWQIYWDQLDYEVEEYPRAVATITAHTLSLNEAWIGV